MENIGNRKVLLMESRECGEILELRSSAEDVFPAAARSPGSTPCCDRQRRGMFSCAIQDEELRRQKLSLDLFPSSNTPKK